MLRAWLFPVSLPTHPLGGEKSTGASPGTENGKLKGLENQGAVHKSSQPCSILLEFNTRVSHRPSGSCRASGWGSSNGNRPRGRGAVPNRSLWRAVNGLGTWRGLCSPGCRCEIPGVGIVGRAPTQPWFPVELPHGWDQGRPCWECHSFPHSNPALGARG